MSPTRASTSMLVRRLVSGVRSSCPASATRRRCWAREEASAASIVLKDAASRPISSRRVTSMGTSRSRVAATCSAAPVSTATGRTAPREANQARTAASSTALPPIRSNRVRMSPRKASVSVRSRAIWRATGVTSAACPAVTVTSPMAWTVTIR